MATKEEKEAAKKAEEEAAKASGATQTDPPKNPDDAPEKTPEELKAESDRVELERLRKEEENRKARAAKENTPDSERMYSESDVRAIVKKMLLEEKKRTEMGLDLIEEEDINKQKRLRLPRFQNKFILGFENTNTDPYFPDTVIHAFDVWDNDTKRNVPWVKVKYEGGETINLPLYTVIERSHKVWVDIVEVLAVDKSYSAGRVERAEVKDYNRSGTGQYVSAKVTQAKYTYKLKLPAEEGTGLPEREVIVGPEVVNW